MQLTGKRFNTKDAYAALKPTVECEDLHGKYIWRTAVPNKVKIFAWLYFKDRLSSRSNLHRKHVVDVGCGPNHTPARALDARAIMNRRTQRECHSYVVKHGEVYKQTTKG
jgi:hypothetical protein